MKKVILLSLFISSVVLVMEEAPAEKNRMIGQTYVIPADKKNPYDITTRDDFSKALSSDQLKNIGTIAALVQRKEKNHRTPMQQVELNNYGIISDRHQEATHDSRELDAITMMRADISELLGGYYVPGDNVHVDGLSLGVESLCDGDLVVVKDQSSIKSILLKTYIPHYACWELEARCGKVAWEVLNAFGEYEDGLKNNHGIIHGLNDRLRGARLAVLKSGTIEVGNSVEIISQDEALTLLTKESLQDRYTNLLEMSKQTAAEVEKKQASILKIRKRAFQAHGSHF